MFALETVAAYFAFLIAVVTLFSFGGWAFWYIMLPCAVVCVWVSWCLLRLGAHIWRLPPSN